MSPSDPVFLAGGIWKPPPSDQPARPAPEPGDGALAAGSPLALRIRGGFQYHPRAEEHYLALSEEFGERLETTSAQFAKQEGVETVHHKHVTRAYDSLVARETKKRVGEKFSDFLVGASISGLIALFIELARLEAPPSAGQMYLLAGLILLLAGAASYSSWSLRR